MRVGPTGVVARATARRRVLVAGGVLGAAADKGSGSRGLIVRATGHRGFQVASVVSNAATHDGTSAAGSIGGEVIAIVAAATDE